MGLIVAENLTKDYHVGEVTVKALKGVSFNIATASFVSFVGPSGSGKTTLLNLLGCLDKPTGGRAAASVLALLCEKGVTVIVAGAFGEKMVQWIERKGMRRLEFSGSVREALKKALESVK